MDGVSKTRAPDPDEFAIGDDSTEISRATTPRPTVEDEKQTGNVKAPDRDNEDGAKKQDAQAAPKPSAPAAATEELPPAVRQKLAKLETLTAKYQGMG